MSRAHFDSALDIVAKFAYLCEKAAAENDGESAHTHEKETWEAALEAIATRIMPYSRAVSLARAALSTRQISFGRRFE